MSIHYDKSIDNRLAAIEGHVRAVRQMLTEDKECEEILLQISAIEGSLSKLGKIILKEHLNHCVKEGIERGDVDILTRFNTVLDKYL
ncbi:MAG: metal-sensing transcriptional repressor [Clostridiaceae bacterium]|jgi:DNA-binding FrmR family transcriptional regulator|nr:metal-sensing transcriptional repressor [Clostridiaceae bacterium]